MGASSIAVNRCNSCHGIWFDSARMLFALKEIAGSDVQLDIGDPVRGQEMNRTQNARRPKCRIPFVKFTFPEQPHIHLEKCSSCGGIFADAGEFSDWKEFTLAERFRHFMRRFKSK